MLGILNNSIQLCLSSSSVPHPIPPRDGDGSLRTITVERSCELVRVSSLAAAAEAEADSHLVRP